MRSVNKKKMVLVVSLAAVVLVSGCTNWQRKYENLNVLHENVKGMLESERQHSKQIAEESAQTIADLQKKIDEGQSAAKASGFEGDVTFDPDAGTITVTVANSILFDSGKETLKKATISELDKISSVIESKYAGKQIAVVGHTDTDPIRKSSWQDNWELSAQRALPVLRYLLKKGIPAENLRAVACGEAKPVASNSTASGKAQNRRVEIVVYIR